MKHLKFYWCKGDNLGADAKSLINKELVVIYHTVIKMVRLRYLLRISIVSHIMWFNYEMPKFSCTMKTRRHF